MTLTVLSDLRIFLHEARIGDVRTIAKLANRIEGKALQAVDVQANVSEHITEQLLQVASACSRR